MGKINLSATGTIKSPPDVADVTFTVRKTAKRCGEAVNEVNSLTSELHKVVLTIFMIDKKDVKTVDVGSDATYSPYVAAKGKKKAVPPKIIGYEAWNSTTVRLRDITRIGEFLADLTDGGASSISQAWDIADKQKLEDEARVLAIGDAQRKAQLYAKETKVKLGTIDDLTENQRWSRPPMAMAKQVLTESVVMDNVPMENGEQSVTITLQVSYNIT